MPRRRKAAATAMANPHTNATTRATSAQTTDLTVVPEPQVLVRLAAVARAFPSADPRARRLGIAFVVAVALVGTTTFSIVGCSDAARPRLAMINALPSTRPAPSSTAAPASSHTTPTPTATDTATRAGGSGQPGAAAAGSPPGQWQYAEDSGPMFGSAGAVYTFRVAVESGLPVTVRGIHRRRGQRSR